jgi:hypothetical protein
MLKGILNLECAVRPLGSSKDATPDEAIARTIFFLDLNLIMIAFHKNVLPVPHKEKARRSTKNTLSYHIIYIFWSVFNRETKESACMDSIKGSTSSSSLISLLSLTP